MFETPFFTKQFWVFILPLFCVHLNIKITMYKIGNISVCKSGFIYICYKKIVAFQLIYININIKILVVQRIVATEDRHDRRETLCLV